MACRQKPRASFVEALGLISPTLSLEWNHKEAAFDLYETTTQNVKHWVMRVPPYMQDRRVLNTIRINNMWNERTWDEEVARAQKARDLTKASATRSVQDKASLIAGDIGNACARPIAGMSGNERLRGLTAEMEREHRE